LSKLKIHQSLKKGCVALTPAVNIDVVAENIDVIDAVNPDKYCLSCCKQFTRKSSLKSHMKVCTGFSSLQCTKCLKVFTSAQGKYHHNKYVKCVSLMAENLEQRKEIEMLKKTSKPNVTNNNNTTNNNNSTINNNFNINMGRYDKETYSHMEYDSLRDLWKEVFPDYGEFIRKFLKMAHKNNPNLKITNLRSNTALEYNGSQYDSVPMEDAVSRCLENVAKCLDVNIPLQKKMMRIQLSTRLNDLIEEKYLDYSDDEERQEEQELHKRCKDNVKHGLYKPKFSVQK
jgi:hypothetical protein